MSLSENEYRVLNVLLREPNLSYTEIAQKLDLSVTSIRNLIFSLMEYTENDSLEDDDKSKLQSNSSYVNLNPKHTHNLSFYGKFNYKLLNLTRYDFFIACSSIDQMLHVKKFCDAHPYTAFRARIHGGTNGVYVLFEMPEEILNMLLISLQAFKEDNLIDDFHQIIENRNFTTFSLLKIDVFDVHQNKWIFNFEEFKKEILENLPGTKLKDYFLTENKKPIMHKLDKIDVLILNEWGYGAGPRKTKAELLHNITTGKIYENFIKDLKLNRYIISDHVDSLLKEKIVKSVGIGFDRKKIQILTTIFYTGQSNTEFLNIFANFINGENFPFDSVLSVGDVTEDKTANFTWWVSFTANVVSKFTEFLFENCISLHTSIVASNPEHLDNYPFYHANFIPDTNNNGGSWNVSNEWCFQEPLKVFYDSNKIKSLSSSISENGKK